MSKRNNAVIHAALIQAAATLTDIYFVNRPTTEELIEAKFKEMLVRAEKKFSEHMKEKHGK